MTFHIPATEFGKQIRESPLWKLGNVGRKTTTTVNGGLLDRGGDGGAEQGDTGEGVRVDGGGAEEEDDAYDGPEKFLLRTKYLTDPESRNTDELRAWASSAPEMKDVS